MNAISALYRGLSQDALKRYLDCKDEFVRNEIQISRASPKSRGPKLTAIEVVAVYGEGALKEIESFGGFITQVSDNGASRKISKAMAAQGLDAVEVAEHLQISAEKLTEFLNGKSSLDCRTIRDIHWSLGIDDNDLGDLLDSTPGSRMHLNRRVRLRYYNKDKDEANFNSNLLFEVNQIHAKLMKYSFLKTILSRAGSNYFPPNENFSCLGPDNTAFIAPDYFSGKDKPTVQRGIELSRKFYEELGVPYTLEPAVDIIELCKKRSLVLFSVDMDEHYSGMTMVNEWEGSRCIVTNARGKNSVFDILRFTVAHEFAHAMTDPDDKFTSVVMNANHGISTRTKNADDSTKYSDYVEMRANALAANLLAPEHKIRSLLTGEETGDQAVRKVSRAFRISESAAKYRLKSVGYEFDIKSINTAISPSTEKTTEINSLDKDLLSLAEDACKRGLIHFDSLDYIGKKVDVKAKTPSFF